MGANRGDTERAVQEALQRVTSRPGTSLLQDSSLLRTAPIGGPEGQGEFVNAAALVHTDLSAGEMLRWLLEVEAEMGRRRVTRWGPREIDLDLLLYEDQVVAAEGLIVPHPRMAFRRFVLEPAAEVAADMVHPQIGWSVGKLLDHLNSSSYLLAIQGLNDESWAKLLVERRSARLWTPQSKGVEPKEGAEPQLWITTTPHRLPPTVQPRLTAILQPPGETIAPAKPGPTLVLAADSPQIEHELTAAVEAMR